MRSYTVDIKCSLSVEVEASSRGEAKKIALHYAGWLDPTMESILDYNADHDGIENATLSPLSTCAVEVTDDDDDEICGQCNDPRCDGCVPFDTPSLDTSFHDHEMGG